MNRKLVKKGSAKSKSVKKSVTTSGSKSAKKVSVKTAAGKLQATKGRVSSIRAGEDQLSQHVADAVLGVDTLWGGDVMCASGTGRFIADSWFSDEPLPAAYTHPAAARLRESGGVSGKTIDRRPSTSICATSIFPKRSPESAPRRESWAGLPEMARLRIGLRKSYLIGLADCLETMWDLAMEVCGQGRRRPLRPLRRSLDRQAT